MDRHSASAARPDSGQMLVRLTGALPYLVRLLYPAPEYSDNCTCYYKFSSFQPSADTPIRKSIFTVQAACWLSDCNFPTKNDNDRTQQPGWAVWPWDPHDEQFYQLWSSPHGSPPPPLMNKSHTEDFLFGASSRDGTQVLHMLATECISKLHPQSPVSQF